MDKPPDIIESSALTVYEGQTWFGMWLQWLVQAYTRCNKYVQTVNNKLDDIMRVRTHRFQFAGKQDPKIPKLGKKWYCALDYRLAFFATVFGIFSVFNFPIVAYKHGGFVFFIPYTLMLFLEGVPLVYLMTLLGQFSSCGIIRIWNICPALGGLGFVMMLYSAYLLSFYMVILGHALVLITRSFGTELPWTRCNNAWNTKNCYTNIPDTDCDKIGLRKLETGLCVTEDSNVTTGIYDIRIAQENKIPRLSSASEYYDFQILGLSPDYDSTKGDLGEFQYQVAIGAGVAWLFLMVAATRGLRRFGWGHHLLTTLPVAVIVLITLVAVSTDQLSWVSQIPSGWRDLLSVTTWGEAAIQGFLAFGPHSGGHIFLGSYNRFRHTPGRDIWLIFCANIFLSFVGCLLIYSLEGIHATQHRSTIEKMSTIKSQGINGMDGVSLLNAANLWCILYFGTYFLFGLGSMVSVVEGMSNGIMELFPKLDGHRGLTVLLIFAVVGLPSLLYCTQAGIVLIGAVASILSGLSALVFFVIFIFMVMSLYGWERLSRDFEIMFKGERVWIGWNLFWAAITPTFLVLLIIFNGVDYGLARRKPEVLELSVYFWLQLLLGIALPAHFIFVFCKSHVPLKYRLKSLFRPNIFWGPYLPKHRRLIRYVKDFHIDPRELEGPDRKITITRKFVDTTVPEEHFETCSTMQQEENIKDSELSMSSSVDTRRKSHCSRSAQEDSTSYLSAVSSHTTKQKNQKNNNQATRV